MKSFIMTGIFLFSNFAFANGFICEAQKSVMKYHSETGKIELRRATSPQFQVTSAEHEDPRTFIFIDEEGKAWGSVQVGTGSYVVDTINWFYANATVTKADGTIIAFLLLKMPVTGASSTASSLIFDELEEMPPSLTVSCSQMVL